MAIHTHRFVRVQDDLYGAQCNSSGNLLLDCRNDATRNTMHFAIDGLVIDHAYGKFNKNPDGSLRGKVVIIANPVEMPVPAGFNQVDTWFRVSAEYDESGHMTRQLDVGRATLIVPEGTMVPEGANALFYNGTIEGRDAVVDQVLLDQGVVQQSMGLRCWSGFGEGEAPKWAVSESQAMYPLHAQHIHVGMHDASLDNDMEMIGISQKIKSFREDNVLHFANADGCDTPYIDDIKAAQTRQLRQIDTFFETAHPGDIERCGAFYDRLRVQLVEDGLEADKLFLNITSKEKQRIAKFIEVQKKLLTIAPHGEIYMAQKDGTTWQKLSTDEMADCLVKKKISADSLIWIHGASPGWQAVTESPLNDLFNDTAEAASRLEVPAPPPPDPAPVAVPKHLFEGMLGTMDSMLSSRAVVQRPTLQVLHTRP